VQRLPACQRNSLPTTTAKIGSGELQSCFTHSATDKHVDPEPAPFRNRGFSERTIRALMDCSIDAPERLLFMKPADLKKIPGVGKGSVDEIMRYRAKFIRSSVMKKNP
jgi:hypothetical protein